MHELFRIIGDIGLVPVIKLDDAAKAADLGKTLLAAGLPVAEVTFRTAAAEEAIRRMSAECPGLMVGAGTVISVALARKAVAAGARFIVSPGYNPATVDWCLEQGVPVLPGVNNPSMIEAGLEKGLDIFKFFPAEASGGLAMLDAMAAPFGQIQFVPTGGIDLANLGAYAANPAVLAVGGSWMVKADLIAGGQWDAIGALCRQAVAAVHGFSFAHLGFNQADAGQATATADILAAMGFPLKDGPLSIFAGTAFELMKSPFRGSMGHIAMRCNNIERALAFLDRFGFKADTNSARVEKGRLSFIYLDRELGGFALHLLRN
jgi:2-dehydro-3-deoxyphosphogluconate aldolase/(4S)-4-hydroxy-2-oxoglutarate aldolase